MAETIIATLKAERGNKFEENRQCISSHEGSIVFLPRGVEPDHVVRVRLNSVEGKVDKRGRVMYWAEFAPPALSFDAKQKIAEEATKLREMDAFPAESGKALLRAVDRDYQSGWNDDFAWYYFTPTGEVYGTKFPPSVLCLFEALQSADESGVTELLLWLQGGVETTPYFESRLRGEEIEWHAVPHLTDESMERVEQAAIHGEGVLAQLLALPLEEDDDL